MQTIVTYYDIVDQSVIFCIFKIDQIINDHEWTTYNALLFSDEIASKPCNHNRLLYVVILCKSDLTSPGSNQAIRLDTGVSKFFIIGGIS